MSLTTRRLDMVEYKVLFNNGCYEDVVSFKVTTSSKQEALESVLKDNPEYSTWNFFVQENNIIVNNHGDNHGDDNYSTPEHLQL